MQQLPAALALLCTSSLLTFNAYACIDELKSLSIDSQLQCLNSFNVNSKNWETTIANNIRAFDTGTDHRVAAATLDLVRRSRSNDKRLAEAISDQLWHQAPLYQDRDKWHVLRLRAYAFVTLSETEVPKSALPMLADALLYVDERMQSVEFGAALRAAASLGKDGRSLIPGILQLYTQRFADEEFSLQHYDTDFSPENATTVQIEATRTLGQLALPEDEDVLQVLQAIIKQGKKKNTSINKRLVPVAELALENIQSRQNSTSTTSKPSLGASRQGPDVNISLLDIKQAGFEDQDGQQWELADAIDRPTLLTFFYSRCQNDGKCSTTIANLANMQKKLSNVGINNNVRILAATYEPQHDNSKRLKRYALDRGFKFNGSASVIRFNPESHQQVINKLDVSVGYNAGWVNSHAVEMVLLDSKGHVAQQYRVHMQNTDLVVNDLLSLLD